MARVSASWGLLLELLLVCLGVAGISAFIGASAGAAAAGARATADGPSSAIYRPSQPSMPAIKGQDGAVCAAAASLFSDASGKNVTVCPASFAAGGNASVEAKGPSDSDLHRLLGAADVASPLPPPPAASAAPAGETVPSAASARVEPAAAASHDNFTFEAQWERMVTGMEEFADDLSYLAGGVHDQALELSKAAEHWGVRTCSLFPYNAPLASTSGTRKEGAVPAYVDDVSSYAGAMSDYIANLAVHAAGLRGHAEWFLVFSEGLKGASDWSFGGEYVDYTAFMTGEVTYLAKWAADLAAFAADWVDNVEYQSYVHYNSTVVNNTVLSISGEAVTFDESAREILDSAKDLAAFAADWSNYVADMEIWAADWTEYATHYGVSQPKAAALLAPLPAGTCEAQ